MAPKAYYQDDCVTLYCGRWQDVLGAVEIQADHVITDPPYSARTHAKQHHGRRPDQCNGEYVSARGLDYDALAEADLPALVGACKAFGGWQCYLTDSELWPGWRAAFAAHGLTDFAPVPCVMKGMNVRLAGDGPSSWAVYLAVARPKELSRWGTLPGAYTGNPFDPGGNTRSRHNTIVVGSKPAWLMQAIIGDYSRPGDTVLDPFAGGATTGIAARRMGRKAVLIEARKEVCDAAASRLWAEQRQLALFGGSQ